MNRHSIVRSGIVIVAASMFLPQQARAGDPVKPNIVLLISDDDDYEHFGFMGSEIAHTPTLDRLVSSGTLFTTAHCPAPLCRPSLASILSGRLPHQHGIYANYLENRAIGGDKIKLAPAGSLANRLKDAGYATYATAKYWEGDPREMGFTHGTVDVTMKGFRKFVRQGQEELFRFIDEQHEQRPMFIWWAPLLPHTPHVPPPKYADRFADTEIPIPAFYKGDRLKYIAAMRKFYAMGTWFDDGVAQLIGKLKETGELENTIFLFYVDNGYTFGQPAKNSPTEKGLRTPMFVTWPDHVPAGRRIDGLNSALDLDVDPYESNNLADRPEHEQRLAEFRKQVLDWWKETGGGPLAVAEVAKTFGESRTHPKLLASFASDVSSSADEAISIDSLLREMIDRDAVARFPSPDFRLRQASSYDRNSKTPDDPAGWFANKDRIDHFVRIEENGGRQEWVIMEHDGPGAIVRSWMPDQRISPHRPSPVNTTMRIYLDGSDEPAIEGHMLDLFNGSGLIPPPLAHKSLSSAVSFFPIPYAKSCKVTLDQPPFYYILTYREYPADTPIRSFTQEDFQAAKPVMQRVGKTLMNPANLTKGTRALIDETIATKAEASVDLPAGIAAVRALSIKLGADVDPQVTRSLVLKIEFDGKPTVWCPVGDFFGAGTGIHPYQGWWRTVGRDGTMTCRWVMPYRESGKVTLLNLHAQPVPVRLEAVVGDFSWDERSLYFHANWRHQYPVATRPFSDFNYVTLTGRGVYVGDTLTVMNPVERWWGEGDEKIWVDGENFPSIFGTGTEDYYAYSWGGGNTDFYEHPFHAQVRSHKYDQLNRKTNTDERNTHGYNTETRSRSLDAMPFGKSLQVDMEVWHWTECDMAYAVATYWYGDADTKTNRTADAAEVARPIVVPPPAASPARPRRPARRFENAIECETMKIVAETDGIPAKPQPLHRYGGHRWSGANHLFVRAREIGDFVEVRFPVEGDGPCKLILHATRSHDYGTLRFHVNGQPAGAEIDLFAEKPTPSGPIELGVFEPVDGSFTLRAEITGKNPKSTGTYFGLDCVVIREEMGNIVPPDEK